MGSVLLVDIPLSRDERGKPSSSSSAAVSASDHQSEGPSQQQAVVGGAMPSQDERMDSETTTTEAGDSDSEDDGSTEGDGEDGKVLSAERPRDSTLTDEHSGEKSSPPLTEYIINVVHFLDAILTNNSTDDHILEFIGQGGMKPLLQLLSLPVLPLDFPTSSACNAIAGACRSIMVSPHLGQ